MEEIMNRTMTLLLAGLAALTVAWPSVGAAEKAFRVGGDVEKPGEWTTAKVARDLAGKVETVRYTMRNAEHTARCVPLLALVEAAQPRIVAQQKNHRVGFVVVLRAADGYTTSFSLAELSPDLGDRKVWVALETDGKPLPENEGPVRLLVPGEGMGHHQRWMFGVTTISVLDGAKLVPAR
jgi:DMSO/TMAO reductase YedYZ molybdopterin-dependent catalytic subunit